MSSSLDTKTIATVSGTNGVETCYVSLKKVVSTDGPIVGSVDVESLDTSLITITDKLLTQAGTVNGKTFVAGELLTFKANSAKEGEGDVPINITYQTDKQRETVRVRVNKVLFKTKVTVNV